MRDVEHLTVFPHFVGFPEQARQTSTLRLLCFITDSVYGLFTALTFSWFCLNLLPNATARTYVLWNKLGGWPLSYRVKKQRKTVILKKTRAETTGGIPGGLRVVWLSKIIYRYNII